MGICPPGPCIPTFLHHTLGTWVQIPYPIRSEPTHRARASLFPSSSSQGWTTVKKVEHSWTQAKGAACGGVGGVNGIWTCRLESTCMQGPLGCRSEPGWEGGSGWKRGSGWNWGWLSPMLPCSSTELQKACEF